MNERLKVFDLSAPEVVWPVLAALGEVGGTPVDYLERLLKSVAGCCCLPWRVVRSSSLGLPDSLRGQDRILEIARRLGAERYLNAPGGRDLYDSASFEAAGVELRFLSDYTGPKISILQRLLDENPELLAREIEAESTTAS